MSDHIIKAPVATEVANWPKLKLTPVQMKLWSTSLTALLWSQGAFADILYSMMTGPTGDQAYATDQVPIAATDGTYMYINPNTFFKYSLEEIIFIICHEVFHNMFNHPGVVWQLKQAKRVTFSDGFSLPYVHEVMNVALDFVVNANLVDGKIGKMPKDALYKPHLVPATMSGLDAYRVIYKASQGGTDMPHVTSNSDGSQQQAFDELLRPGKGRGKTANEAISDRNQAAWDAALDAAKTAMHGKGSQALNRIFNKATEVEYDWFSLLRTSFNRSVGSIRQTWDFLDPEFVIRGIGAPGRLNYGCNFVSFVIDSSGSITQHMADTFMAHGGIIVDEVRPKEILRVQCDDKIHEWEHVYDGTQLKTTLTGSGGTDFRPPFERITLEGLKPDILVYFTDCQGSYPVEAPPYPVIWASIYEWDALSTGYRPPFGEFIYIPLGKKGSNNDD